MSKIGKLLKAFESGANLTSKQISARFGLKNPTAAISELRQTGHQIQRDRNKTKSFYKMGRTVRRTSATSPQKALSN